MTTFVLCIVPMFENLKFWQVVDALYDCKSEVIGPGFFRFKAEIGDFLAMSYCNFIFLGTSFPEFPSKINISVNVSNLPCVSSYFCRFVRELISVNINIWLLSTTCRLCYIWHLHFCRNLCKSSSLLFL